MWNVPERVVSSGMSSVVREVGIGIVGYGTMGRAHAYAYAAAPRIRQLPCRPRVRAISGRSRAAVQQAALDLGAEWFTTDWRELVEAADVDIVDICTPPGTHAEIVEAAAECGKAILCEKPLAASWEDACRAAAAVQRGAGEERDRLQLPAAAGAVADEADGRLRPARRGAAVARKLAVGRVRRSRDPVRLAL